MVRTARSGVEAPLESSDEPIAIHHAPGRAIVMDYLSLRTYQKNSRLLICSLVFTTGA